GHRSGQSYVGSPRVQAADQPLDGLLGGVQLVGDFAVRQAVAQQAEDVLVGRLAAVVHVLPLVLGRDFLARGRAPGRRVAVRGGVRRQQRFLAEDVALLGRL